MQPAHAFATHGGHQGHIKPDGNSRTDRNPYPGGASKASRPRKKRGQQPEERPCPPAMLQSPQPTIYRVNALTMPKKLKQNVKHRELTNCKPAGRHCAFTERMQITSEWHTCSPTRRWWSNSRKPSPPISGKQPNDISITQRASRMP